MYLFQGDVLCMRLVILRNETEQNSTSTGARYENQTENLVNLYDAIYFLGGKLFQTDHTSNCLNASASL